MAENDKIIEAVEGFVKGVVTGHDSGHGWSHIERVVRLALHIHDIEKTGNRLIIELGALLHDVGDHKFATHDGPAEIRKLLINLEVDEEIINEVVSINERISFSKGDHHSFKSDELKIVQDADRLDAMGAIGIARAFNYGGFKGREIYDPKERYVNPGNFEAGRSASTGTVNHFYEKLLLLKNLMNTTTGIKLAEERHAFMVRYLEQFYREWDPGDR
ncbi:MAG TPA: HD domain-containing protein [Bacteroidales bacterium]|nr:HD domain-containing protein [Bacteroidales bacterium]